MSQCYKCRTEIPYGTGVCDPCHALGRCSTEGCTGRKTGKSKYCQPCARVAREKWRDMVAEKAAERDARYDMFSEAYESALKAAAKAATEATTTPMDVYDSDLAGNPIPGGNRYRVEGGACGFAWVKLPKANSSFANWYKKTVGSRRGKDYGGGLTILWCPAGGTQSYEIQMAAARAAADVLKDRGIDCYADGRLD